MKLCKDCKWIEFSTLDPIYHKCRNVTVAGLEPVMGELRKVYCDTARETGKCGATGVYWEPKDGQ